MQEKKVTEADKMWEAMKGLTLPMFGLPNQVLENYAERVPLDDNLLHLKIKVSSVLPALESVLNTDKKFNYDLVQAKEFIVISRTPKV